MTHDVSELALMVVTAWNAREQSWVSDETRRSFGYYQVSFDQALDRACPENHPLRPFVQVMRHSGELVEVCEKYLADNT